MIPSMKRYAVEVAIIADGLQAKNPELSRIEAVAKAFEIRRKYIQE